MKPLLVLGISSILVGTTQAQVQPQPRTRAAGCLYINNRIYCYGGRNVKNNNEQTITMNDMGLSSPPNYMFGFVPIYDTNTTIMQGGVGYGNGTAFPQATMAYDTESNSWRFIPSDIVPQTYQATPTSAGPTSIWTNQSVPDNIGQGNTFMLSVTGSDGSIYYFGGVWQNVNQTMPNGTITYNRAKKHPVSGNVIPSPRRRATVNMIPYTQSVVMYGGEDINSGLVVSDDVYKLDLKNFEWTRITPQGNGPTTSRHGHNGCEIYLDPPRVSNELYVCSGHGRQQQSVFFLFGMDSNNNAQDDFHILDVSNWTWTSSFSVQLSGNLSSDSDNSTATGGEALSGGAIAGIVIGCIAAAAIAGSLQNEYQAFNDDNDHSPPPPPRYDDKLTAAAAAEEAAGAAPAVDAMKNEQSDPYRDNTEGIMLQQQHLSNASSGQAAFEDNASGSFKPDIALSLKPDTVEDDDTNANVKHLKLRPMRPDGE
ncbi:hypothetical protein VTP01DRAFT_8023 [Rhizomucor pusillus]|uniref:uncharacterized protein n=1 Tax=Rhizomucor pusillus TaxID=4840 RepID=UPI0037439FC9